MAEGRGHTIQILIAVIGLVAAIGGAMLSNWQNIFGPPNDRSAAAQPNITQPIVNPTPAPVTPSYTPVSFDGRVGMIEVRNTSLYEFKVTLWHPDSASVFGTWSVAGTSKRHLKIQGEAFHIGNDWGVQLGDSEVKSVGRATEWRNGEWRLSQDTFFR
ncbi:MAG: hypothetical protein AAFV19_14790 [Pseudomonadota bacterium]